MRIAYLILAHRNPQQVKRLLKILDNDIFIHIDSKYDLKNFYISSPNINYINKRVDVTWGGYSMIEATLKLIRAAKENFNYDFYILLSGDDYPIKSLNEFEQFLMKHREYSFMEYDKFDDKWHHLKGRYRNFLMFEKKRGANKVFQKIINIFINKRNMYRSMQAYKGSQWWCLNSESIEYILNYINDNKSILRYFKHTKIPDEMFFQIILLNSYLRAKIINNNLRYIVLEGKHAEILTVNNYSDFKDMENKFFARKFDLKVDAEVLELLDKTVLGI